MSTDKIPSHAKINDLYYIIYYVMQLTVIYYKSLLSLNVHSNM